jgi:plasmid stabilization system protein ParE
VNGIVFAPEARKDLLEIVDYVAARNIEAAERLRDRFIAAVEMLARRPTLGHLRNDLARPDMNVRFWPVGHYLVIYRPVRRGIQIVRILSGYRDIAAILK